jgi:hypothetical protein
MIERGGLGKASPADSLFGKPRHSFNRFAWNERDLMCEMVYGKLG